MKSYKIDESLFDRRYLDYDHGMLNSLSLIRDRLSETLLRPQTFSSIENTDSLKKEDYLKSFDQDGRFTDLKDDNRDTEKAIKRLTHLIVSDYFGKELPSMVLTSLLYYINREVSREDKGATRFHVSIFALPVCAINIFFAQYEKMKMAETGNEKYAALYDALASLMIQSWTLPLRNDDTDKTPFSVERFQHHVWWEAGNAVAYRPTFETAVCLLNIPMFEIITKVMQEATRSVTSIHGSSFWNEGICADGFGWGHGRQVYNNGYPTDSMHIIMRNFIYLKDTAFAPILDNIGWDNLVYYVKSISWSSYKSYYPPMMSRHCFELGSKKIEAYDAKSKEISRYLVNDFASYLTEKQFDEMKTMLEKGSMAISDCVGIRYFYNNDTLIAKSEDSYFYYNTASSRLKGVESADFMADKRNFYTRDGSYTIFTDENAYKKVRGTWNPCELPGVTERILPKENISSEVNWQGYSSLYNFSGGIATSESAVNGFIYEKNGTRGKDGANTVHLKCSKEILKVYAKKSVFLNKDTIVFLGSNIEDRNSSYGYEIKTTVDNTGLLDSCRLITSEGDKELVSGVYTTPIYVRNNGLVYGLPEGRKEILSGLVMSDWGYLNQQNEGKENVAEKVLKIQINHGYAPMGEKYSYWISKNTEIDVNNPGFKVIAHDAKVHSVEFDGKVQAVFYEGAEISTQFGTVSVSGPSIFHLEKTGNRLTCYLSDPEQIEGKSIEVNINGNSRIINMPEKKASGKQVSFDLEVK